MSSYNATYTISGTAQPARVSLLKDRAAIQLYTAEGDRTVYWFYHNIRRDATHATTFAYTAYPPQTLEVPDGATADALALRLISGKREAGRRRNRTALTLLAGCVLFFTAVYFFLLPWLGAGLAARVPVSYEKELGDKMFQSMKRDFQIDEMGSAQATAFFDAMDVPSKYNIRITVVKGDIANAFAMPGGHIVVYDKLLNQLSSYPQLAALLAHEAVHIENRHSLKSLCRQLSTTFILSALLGDAGALSGAVLNSADKLKNLSYSRSLESEADADGLNLLLKRNIDAAGFTGLFRILQKEETVQQSEWISSHPNLDGRIRNIEAHALFKNQQPVSHPTLQQLFLKMKTAD